MTIDPINPAPTHVGMPRHQSPNPNNMSLSVERLLPAPDRPGAVSAKAGSSRYLVDISIVLQSTRLHLLLLPTLTALNSTTVQDQPEAQATFTSLRLQLNTKRYLYHTDFPTAFQNEEIVEVCPAGCTRKISRDWTPNTLIHTIWTVAYISTFVQTFPATSIISRALF